MSAELVNQLRKYCPTRPDANWARVPKEIVEAAIRALAAASPANTAEATGEREAFEAWKLEPAYYCWNTSEQHALLNFRAGWHARARPALTDEVRNISSVKQTSDMTLQISFMSCRSAGAFCRAIERHLTGSAQA